MPAVHGDTHRLAAAKTARGRKNPRATRSATAIMIAVPRDPAVACGVLITPVPQAISASSVRTWLKGSCSGRHAAALHSGHWKMAAFSACASGMRPAASHAFAAFPKGDRPERVHMLRPVQDFLPAGTYALLRQTWIFSTFTLLIVVNALPVRSRLGHTRECGRREATNAKRNCLR